jgi:KipI family sensor histidine kinase inhibitor
VSVRVAVRQIGEGALLVEYPGASEDSANRAAIAAARRLSGRPGILDAVPGARTLYLAAEGPIDRPALESELSAEAGAEKPGRTIRVPVRYGGEHGPDLAELSRARGLTPEELARRHAAAAYRVAFLGFAPGFAYCVGLPEELATPRLATPRTRVPAGTLAIGGSYTGIYPSETPGGWRLIGRSPARLFDPTADPPTLFLPGDAAVFESAGPEVSAVPPGDRPATAYPEGSVPVFRVVSPGLFTSLQGAPRHGRGSYGVPAGGAMDLPLLSEGNRLVENAPGAPALEITLQGPELLALSECRAAAAGDLEIEVNGSPRPSSRPFTLVPGDRLRLARVTRGVRAYLCIEGGLAFAVADWQTRRLGKEDTVHRAAPGEARVLLPLLPRGRADGVVRVRPGPQEDRFTEKSFAAFFDGPWRVSASSDRRGVRLDGEPLVHAGSAEVAPEGTAPGAIQVPADGQPIILGPDRPVTGGYAKIGTVIAEDWPLVAQALPGASLRFRLA